jgi:hypothetical protein
MNENDGNSEQGLLTSQIERATSEECDGEDDFAVLLLADQAQ